MTEELDVLKARLDELETTVSVISLEGEYARSWDVGDAAGWASLFTEDGVFGMIGVEGREDVVHRGRRVASEGATSVVHFRFDYVLTSEGWRIRHRVEQALSRHRSVSYFSLPRP